MTQVTYRSKVCLKNKSNSVSLCVSLFKVRSFHYLYNIITYLNIIIGIIEVSISTHTKLIKRYTNESKSFPLSFL